MGNKSFVRILSLVLVCILPCQVQAFSQIDIMYAVADADADKVAEYLRLEQGLVNVQPGEDRYTPLMRAFSELHKVLVYKGTSKKTIINQILTGTFDLAKGLPVAAVSLLTIGVAATKSYRYSNSLQGNGIESESVTISPEEHVEEKKGFFNKRWAKKHKPTQKTQNKDKESKENKPEYPSLKPTESTSSVVDDLTTSYQVITNNPVPRKPGWISKQIKEAIGDLIYSEEGQKFIKEYRGKIHYALDLVYIMFAFGFITAGIFGTCYGLNKGLSGANQLANVPVAMVRRNHKIKNYERIILTLLAQEKINLNLTDKNGKTVHEILQQLMLECVNDAYAYHVLRTFEILLNDQLKRA